MRKIKEVLRLRFELELGQRTQQRFSGWTHRSGTSVALADGLRKIIVGVHREGTT